MLEYYCSDLPFTKQIYIVNANIDNWKLVAATIIRAYLLTTLMHLCATIFVSEFLPYHSFTEVYDNVSTI